MLMELSELDLSKSKTVSFRNVKMEIVIPLFMGIAGSLFLCAFVILYSNIIPSTAAAETEYVEYIAQEREVVNNVFLLETVKGNDPIMVYYNNPDYQEWVIDFFAGICSNRDIAHAILHNADVYKVSASLAFALGWEESKFNPYAINRSNHDGSVDRGLFQLNSRSFPALESADFFNISHNARYGISHLRHCLESGGTEVSALAMYNAGTSRVTTSGAPKVTLNYISRILENRSKIESRFHTMLIREEERRLLIEKEKSENLNLKEPRPAQFQFSRTLSSVSPL
jgi:hypothetical protein